MKKVLSIVLALVLCLSLCACGVSKEKVEEELQGTWEYTWYASVAGFYCSVIYEFDDGVLNETFIRNGDETSQRGYYIITDKVVEIWFDGEDKPNAELTYTYENGELSLVDYGDGTVEKHYSKVR